MGTLSLRRRAAYVLLFYVMLLLLVPHAGHGGDMHFWYMWSLYIFEHGLGNVYQVPDNNYNPLYHYCLWAFGQIVGTPAKIEHYRHWLKAFPLIFDIIGAFWAASLVRERDRRFGLIWVLLFNIGYLYNTMIWEQVDAIYTCFAFGAVVLAVQQRAVASMLCFVLALAAKTQAIIFLPPLLLLWGPLWWQRPWRLVQASVAGTLLAVLVLAPFIWWSWENYVPRIIEINMKAAEVYPRLSMSAFNIWYLLAPHPSPPDVADTLPFAGLTYRAWGLLLFMATSAVALLPLLLVALRRLRSQARLALSGAAEPASDMALTLLSCGLIPLLFAFFNTQMHERYWHAAILFLGAYGFLRRDYLPYILASAAYFFNLEGVLHYLSLLNYNVLLFQPWFVASLFGLAMVLGLIKLYRMTAWREDWRRIRLGATAETA